MTGGTRQNAYDTNRGSILAVVVLCIVLLTILGLGMLQVAYANKLRAIRVKNATIARMTAEAGYEQGAVWMGQQANLLRSLAISAPGKTGTVGFPGSSAGYNIECHAYFGMQPMFRIISDGQCGNSKQTIDVLVSQAVGGWDMRLCRVPNSPWTTRPEYFMDGEVIDMPMHVNCNGSPQDRFRDIYVSGNPLFLRSVSMGESRYARTRSRDKYGDIINLFRGGIYFNQPNTDIGNHEKLTARVERFKEFSTKTYMGRKRGADADTSAAVQLEFYVNGEGEGMVDVITDCTVQLNTPGNMDYKLGSTTPYEKYPLYAYHYVPQDVRVRQVKVTDTYVRQIYGKDQSDPGGQIYIKGDAIIGGDVPGLLKGALTVVATGNIWVANSTQCSDDGTIRGSDGMPAADNPNVLGLVSLNGVVKVIDPGLSAGNSGAGPTDRSALGLVYRPVGLPSADAGAQEYDRVLPAPLVVEAAITSGGGGWGVENVGNRGGEVTDLIVRGAICEAIRGATGVSYLKRYFLDERLLAGILPGDIWVSSKYLPAPGGWSDYQSKD